MRELKEKFINGFITKGPEVEHNGEKLRPNTTTSVAIGKVSGLEESGNNNLKCVVKVPGAKFDFSGYLNDNTPVANLLREAKENDYPICVRFERKRKKDADPTKDISELTSSMDVARDNVVWITAGVFNFSTEEWILTDDAVSNPDEDPDYVNQEIKNASYSTEGFFQSSNTPKLQTTDLDWKANHLLSMHSYAAEHSIDNEIDLNEKEIKVLAIYMLRAVDQLQMEVKNIASPNYNDYSHTKARGILFSWMRQNPLSREIMSVQGGFNKWVRTFLAESVELWAWANEEAQK